MVYPERFSLNQVSGKPMARSSSSWCDSNMERNHVIRLVSSNPSATPQSNGTVEDNFGEPIHDNQPVLPALPKSSPSLNGNKTISDNSDRVNSASSSSSNA